MSFIPVVNSIPVISCSLFWIAMILPYFTTRLRNINRMDGIITKKLPARNLMNRYPGGDLPALAISNKLTDTRMAPAGDR